MYEVIDDFHRERISRIKRDDTPKKLPAGPKLALFLIPEDVFRDFKQYDLFKFQGQTHSLLNPLFSDKQDIRRAYNFEGKLHTFMNPKDECLSYVQLHRNGIVEALGSCILCEGSTFTPIYSIEQEIIFRVKEYLVLLQEMNVEPSFVCFLDLLGVRDLEIQDSSTDTKFLDIHPISHEDLHIPKMFIDRYEIDASELFKLAFDRIWNACGYPRSFGYDKKGKKIYYSLKDKDSV